MLDQETRRAPVVVTLPADIDLTCRDVAYGQLYDAFASGARVVIAEFTATAFCDCSSLRRLAAIRHRAVAGGAELRLVIPPGSPVHRVARLTGLDSQLPVYASREEAAAATVRHPKQPGPLRRADGRTAVMADVIDLHEASCLHIVRWQARLGEPGRRGGPAPGPDLAAVWDTVATLIDLHMSADEEIVAPAVYYPAPSGRALARELSDAHEDIREIIREAALQSPGSPLWQQLSAAALAAWGRQLDREAHGLAGGCLRRADPALRGQLARQWRAFREAQIRDRYPGAPPKLPTCRLRLARPAPPRLADPAFSPLACTCQACDQVLTRVPLPGASAGRR